MQLHTEINIWHPISKEQVTALKLVFPSVLYEVVGDPENDEYSVDDWYDEADITLEQLLEIGQYLHVELNNNSVYINVHDYFQ
jgi:hypothetical protein